MQRMSDKYLYLYMLISRHYYLLACRRCFLILSVLQIDILSIIILYYSLLAK